ncbi:hypothetical protein GcM3_222013 [Golovinomyces cichoracearum]|uniref:Csep0475 effector protein n=1 Tax=Golovinomyces cichoracearum TaxID=62708 RepID=A0A420H1Z6_9PEZI|nr:hypothetical protein GcM3_222013 [Golovinomyces cichoracearum]
MRSLCDVIIGFATVLQITLASSVIPFHSESFGVLARNPSSSIKEKRFLPHNVFAKRQTVTPKTATCTSSIYSNSKLQLSLQKNCQAKKAKLAKSAKSAKSNKPPFPVFAGSNTFFPTPGPYFQIPAKPGFFPVNFLKNLFLGGLTSVDFVFMSQSSCSFTGVARKTKGVLQPCVPKVNQNTQKSGNGLFGKFKQKKQQFSAPAPPAGVNANNGA